MADPVVALRDVRVRHGPSTVLGLPSFGIHDGEIVAIIGPTARVNPLFCACIMVTHDLHEAAALGKRIGVLSRGKLIQLAAAEDIFTRPASEEVAAIAGMQNRIAGVVAQAAPGAVSIHAQIRRISPWSSQYRVVLHADCVGSSRWCQVSIRCARTARRRQCRRLVPPDGGPRDLSRAGASGAPYWRSPAAALYSKRANERTSRRARWRYHCCKSPSCWPN